jgi:hypothetical protein
VADGVEALQGDAAQGEHGDGHRDSLRERGRRGS